MKTQIKLFLLIAILHIFFAGCNSKDSSSDSSEDELDTAVVTADSNATVIELILKEVTAVETPTTDTTPKYTFSSTKAGTITYGGSCSSSTTVAVTGNNTITLNTLSDGTYSDCTITVTDNAGNE
jgi:heat shock protein HslJ